MTYRVAVALCVFGLSAPWVSAQVPAGGEFRINTTPASAFANPGVVSDAFGNFVVVWARGGLYSEDVAAQRFDATGAPRGGQFRVNTYTPNTQALPSVASGPAGNFVVTWSSRGQDGSGYGIFAQRYDSSAVPQGGELRVNTFTTYSQHSSSVALDAHSGFVVSWSSRYQDGSDYGVFAQRYDPSGVPRGGEFRVNTFTPYNQLWPSVASDASGDFVIVWSSIYQDGSDFGVFAQRYDASGVPRGGEFRVNTYTTGAQFQSSVASDSLGNFVVVWASNGQDGQAWGVFGQRFDASGAALGGEFQVNTFTTYRQWEAHVAADALGNFVVVWRSQYQDGSSYGVFAQRYASTGTPRGAEFAVNTYTTQFQMQPSAAFDGAGNFLIVWASNGQEADGPAVHGQRFGGLQPVALSLDAAPDTVLEPGETVVALPSWKNVNGAVQSFDGVATGFAGPPAAGVSYDLLDGSALYGSVANGATQQCTDCYQVHVGFGSTRPATHWDATLTELLTPDPLGQTKPWSLHVGESFTDVPRTSAYYRFVETLLHKSVTGGCSANAYCPTSPVTREQMSVFVLVGKEGSAYLPVTCGTPVFGDVPASSAFCRWIEDLSRRGVVSGCGGGNYCPADPVTREQMSVFLLATLDPTLSPPACGVPVFADVPASSGFCRWIEELARRGITAGCGGGNYCPTDPVTREQMAVFVTATFGLTLYGP